MDLCLPLEKRAKVGPVGVGVSSFLSLEMVFKQPASGRLEISTGHIIRAVNESYCAFHLHQKNIFDERIFSTR